MLNRVFTHLTVILMLLMSAQAWAQSAVLEEHIRDMPEIKVLEPSDLQDWQSVNESALGIAYNIHMPADWVMDTDLDTGGKSLNEQLLTEIAYARSPAGLDAPSALSISAMILAEDLSLQQWVLDYWREQGFTRVGLQEMSEQEVELFYVGQSGAESTIFRALVLQLDDKIVLIRFIMPQNTWGKMQGLQKAMLDRVQVKPTHISAATQTRYDFGGVFTFVMPERWAFESKRLEGVKLANTTIQRADQSMHIFHVPEVDEAYLGRATDNIKAAFVRERGEISAQPDEFIDDITYGLGVERGVIEVWPIANGEELWLAILQGQGSYAVIAAAIPGREADYIGWTRESRVIRQLAESVAFSD